MGSAASLEYSFTGIPTTICTQTVGGIGIRVNNPSPTAVVLSTVSVDFTLYGRSAGQTSDSQLGSVITDSNSVGGPLSIGIGTHVDFPLGPPTNGSFTVPAGIASFYIKADVTMTFSTTVTKKTFSSTRINIMQGLTLSVTSPVTSCEYVPVTVPSANPYISAWTVNINNTSYTQTTLQGIIPGQPAGTYSASLIGHYGLCQTHPYPFTLIVYPHPDIFWPGTAETTIYADDPVVNIPYAYVTGNATTYKVTHQPTSTEWTGTLANNQIVIPSDLFLGVTNTTVYVTVYNAGECSSPPRNYQIKWEEFFIV